MDNLVYLKSAKAAHAVGDLKRSLILFKHVSLDDEDTVNQYAQITNEMWLRRKENTNIEIIKDAYATILGNADPSFVSATIYIKLSNIYIFEHSFPGALEIMRLAASNGHGSSPLILLQSWLLLMKLSQTNDAMQYMDYLTSSVTLERRSVQADKTICIYNSEFKLVYAYLHTASYLESKIKSSLTADMKMKAIKRFHAILLEAFQIQHGRYANDFSEANSWLNNSEMWLEMGLNLDDSPFVLVAEQSYWEAFMRNRFLELPLENTVNIMKRTKREDEVNDFIVKCFILSPLNGYCRRSLADQAEQLNNPEWTQLFKNEHLGVSILQARVRGYQCRQHWPARKRTLFAQKMKLEVKLTSLKRIKYFANKKEMKRILTLWNKTSHISRKERRQAAVLLQKVWRSFIVRQLYLQDLTRYMAANKKYLVLSEMHYECTRRIWMLRWHKSSIAHRFRSSAQRILNMLHAHRNHSKLSMVLPKMVQVIAMRRRKTCKRTWRKWMVRYNNRQRNHARITLRFFVRDVLLRRKRKRRELNSLIAETTVINRTLQRLQPWVPKLWMIWRNKLFQARAKRASLVLARELPVVFLRRKNKKIFTHLRALHEKISSLNSRWKYKVTKTIIDGWRILMATLILQRFVRVIQARKKVAKRRKVIKTVDHWYYKHILYRQSELYGRWSHLVRMVMLRKRMCVRTMRRKWFRYIKRQKLLRITRHKLRVGGLLFAVHDILRRRGLLTLKAKVINCKALDSLVPLFNSAWRRQLTAAFEKLRIRCQQQILLHSLVTCCISSQIDRLFWFGAGESVLVVAGGGARSWTSKQRDDIHARRWSRWKPITASASYQRRVSLLDMATVSRRHSITDHYYPPRRPSLAPIQVALHPWETYSPRKRILLKMSSITCIRVFRNWMALYRLRLRLRVDSSMRKAKSILLDTIDQLSMRRRKLVILQRFFRHRVRRRKLRIVLHAIRMDAEKSLLISRKSDRYLLVRTFRNIISIGHIRKFKRLQLQCFWRIIASLKVLVVRKLLRIRMNKAENQAMEINMRMIKKHALVAFKLVFTLSTCASDRLMTIHTKPPQNITNDRDDDDEGLRHVKVFSEPSNKDLIGSTQMEIVPATYGDKLAIRKRRMIESSLGKVDFQSLEFQRHYSLLQRGNVFIYDYSNNSSNSSSLFDIHTEKSTLTTTSLYSKTLPIPRGSSLSPSLVLSQPQTLSLPRSRMNMLTTSEIFYFLEQADTVIFQGGGRSSSSSPGDGSGGGTSVEWGGRSNLRSYSTDFTNNSIDDTLISGHSQRRYSRISNSKLSTDVNSTTMTVPQANGGAEALKLMSRRFRGSKLVFCGGRLEDEAVSELYYFLLAQESSSLLSDIADIDIHTLPSHSLPIEANDARNGSTTSSNPTTSSSPPPTSSSSGAGNAYGSKDRRTSGISSRRRTKVVKTFSLHFSQSLISLTSTKRLARCLSAGGAPLRELAVDEMSFGVLGLSILLAAAGKCHNLEVLLVTLAATTTPIAPSGRSSQSSYAVSLSQLSTSKSLKELRFFGCELLPGTISCLIDVISTSGLENLQLLEFTAHQSASTQSEELKKVALNRITRKSVVMQEKRDDATSSSFQPTNDLTVSIHFVS